MMAPSDIPDSRCTYHVLALSGGGFRGLYTATVLDLLEADFGPPLASRFDLLCGTSVGGLLALGLAMEIPARDLKALFLEKGTAIFGRPRGLPWMLWRPRHTAEGLKRVLEELFVDATIGDLKHRVLVPAVSYSTGNGQFFKTPHHDSLRLDREMRLVDVALATSAAPLYFPLARNERGVFVDGGLFGNAPGYFGLHEVRHFLPGGEDAHVRLLAIGTMKVGSTFRASGTLDQGLLHWREKVFDLVISAQASSAHWMLTHQLKEDYLLIDDDVTSDQSCDVRKMDRVDSASITTLTHRGVHAAQIALGKDGIKPFRAHVAPKPTFFT